MSGRVAAWLQRKLGCSHQSADLAQDVFIKWLSMGLSPQCGWHLDLSLVSLELIMAAARLRVVASCLFFYTSQHLFSLTQMSRQSYILTV